MYFQLDPLIQIFVVKRARKSSLTIMYSKGWGILLAHMIRIELRRAVHKWRWFIPFMIILGCCIEGILVYFDPIHPNAFSSFLYGIGKGADAILGLVFPLAIPLFVGGSLAVDRRTGFENYILSRMNYKQYIGAKLLSAAIASVMLVLITELIAFGVALLIYPDFAYKPVSYNAPGYATHLYLTWPYLYVLLIICNNAVAAISISFISVMFSTMIKNMYVVLALPWVSFLLLQYVIYSAGNGDHYAPLDLIGLYMVEQDYTVLEVPMLWISLAVVLAMMTFAITSLKYKARLKR